MATSTTVRCASPICDLPSNSLPLIRSSFSVKFPLNSNRFNRLSIRSSSTSVSAPPAGGLTPAISLSDNALKHLKRIRSERSADLCLRVGVKQGGCSGMSYMMDFECRENTRVDDSVIEQNGFTIGERLRTSDPPYPAWAGALLGHWGNDDDDDDDGCLRQR